MSKKQNTECPKGFILNGDGVCVPENAHTEVPKAATIEEVQAEFDNTPLATKFAAFGKIAKVFEGLSFDGLLKGMVDVNVEGLKRTGASTIAAGTVNLVMNGVYSISDEDSDVGKFLRGPAARTVMFGVLSQMVALGCNVMEPKFPNLRYIAVAATQNSFEHWATTLAIAEKLRGLHPALDFFLAPAPDAPKL